jgi:hypothetical protein
VKLKRHWKAANIHAWHGRIRAKLKKSLEHKYTMAWTRPRQVNKVIGTEIYNGMDASTPSVKSHWTQKQIYR